MNTRLVIAIKQAFKHIGRNITMALTSLFSITAILLILGLCLIVIVNIDYMTEGIKTSFDTVQLNIEDGTDADTKKQIITQFEDMPEVEAVTYQTKDQLLSHWKEKWGEEAEVLDRLDENPLRDAITVQVVNIASISMIVERADAIPAVASVTNSSETVDKLISITKTIRLISLIIIAFLLIISIVVVSNTIKLTVLAREREITIMKYVGATNWFIRGPFLMEGVIIGFIASAITSGVIAIVYHFLVQNYSMKVTMLMSSGLVPEQHLIFNIVFIFLAIGVSIGACGSIISMRRFLDT